MAYTTPVSTSILQSKAPAPIRVLSGAPATADAGVPASLEEAAGKVFTFESFSKLRLGVLLDGGTTPTATMTLLQWVPSVTEWLSLDTQTSKSSRHSWEVNCPPGTYHLYISALSGSPTGVTVTAQAAERF